MKPSLKPDFTVEIKKAIITAAGRNQRTLPLQTLIDRDGISKTALRIIIEEALAAGIEELGVVICPGDADAFRAASGPHSSRIELIEQSEPLGYGHAVLCGKRFVGNEPFLLLVGDHLAMSREAKSCAGQLVDIARTEACPVSGVQATPESKLPFYGAVGGRLAPGRQHLYEIERVLEKPTPTEAEQSLIVPGLRAGYYLCFFGMHVLTPSVMEILEQAYESKSALPLPLSIALSQLAQRERYLALELQGRRYDIGLKYGLFLAQLALAMEGKDRESLLVQLVEVLATRNMH